MLTLKSGATSVKIERTDKPFEFKLNDQLIDMHKYPTQERLGFALDAVLNYLRSGSYKYMNAKTSEKNVIDPKLDKLTDNLSKTDGQINAWYGRALQCDCADSKNGQVACTEKMGFGEVKDPANLTEPRQKGMDRCQRLLYQIAQFPAPRDFLLIRNAKEMLEKLDQKISDIKAEPAINGLNGNSSK